MINVTNVEVNNGFAVITAEKPHYSSGDYSTVELIKIQISVEKLRVLLDQVVV